MEFLSSIFHPIVELMSTLVTYAFQLTQMIGLSKLRCGYYPFNNRY